jgi:hypothetical protein
MHDWSDPEHSRYDRRHFAFLTNCTEDITIVEAEHRDHAVVEHVIADLKRAGAGALPSGEFNADGAWTVLGALAHNLPPLDPTDRPARHHHPRRPDPAAGYHDRRPPDPPRPILDLHLFACWPGRATTSLRWPASALPTA